MDCFPSCRKNLKALLNSGIHCQFCSDRSSTGQIILMHRCYQEKFLSTCYMNTSKTRISLADPVTHVQGRYYKTQVLKSGFNSIRTSY